MTSDVILSQTQYDRLLRMMMIMRSADESFGGEWEGQPCPETAAWATEKVIMTMEESLDGILTRLACSRITQLQDTRAMHGGMSRQDGWDTSPTHIGNSFDSTLPPKYRERPDRTKDYGVSSRTPTRSPCSSHLNFVESPNAWILSARRESWEIENYEPEKKLSFHGANMKVEDIRVANSSMDSAGRAFEELSLPTPEPPPEEKPPVGIVDVGDFNLQLKGLSMSDSDSNSSGADDDTEPAERICGQYEMIVNGISPPHNECTLIQIAAGDFFIPGDLLKRWQLGEIIGRGSSSVVKIAKGVNDPREREVAIKIISKLSDNYKESTVSREVFIWRLLMETGGHENIVNMYEVGENDQYVYLVMECLTGGPLVNWIADGREVSEQKAASIASAMLKSLEHCHKLNIIHRDVKPENFVFSCKDEDAAVLKLTDFGISFYDENPDVLCKSLVGTPLYVSPEVLLRQPYGAETDLWSVGVVVHILLKGEPPFDDQNPKTLVRKIKYKHVVFDGSEWIFLSDDAKNFLQRLLEKDPCTRLTAAEALKHPWIINTVQYEANQSRAMFNARLNINAFFARRRWKAAIRAVQCINRMLHKECLRALCDVRIPDSQRLLAEYKQKRSASRVYTLKLRGLGHRRKPRSSHKGSDDGDVESDSKDASYKLKMVRQGYSTLHKNVGEAFRTRRRRSSQTSRGTSFTSTPKASTVPNTPVNATPKSSKTSKTSKTGPEKHRLLDGFLTKLAGSRRSVVGHSPRRGEGT